MQHNPQEDYRDMQETRKLYSGLIMGYNSIFIPVGAGAIALAIYSFRENVCGNFDIIPISLWFLFATSMICWRLLCHHVDNQIVDLYYRMMELEEMLGEENQCRYYYSNLNNKGKKMISDSLDKVEYKEINTYHKFKDICKQRQRNFYTILLNTCHTLGKNSVTARGHDKINYTVGAVGMFFLIIIIVKMVFLP